MNVYLKPNIQVDPLFNQWYAWNLLIPPVTAAVNTLERHLKMMTSYVNSPAMHAAALKNPAMRGGPFIDLAGGRVAEVKQLIQDTQSRCGQLVSFAKALVQLNRMLEEKAKGMAMDALYEFIPEPLRGYVELCYGHGQPPVLPGSRSAALSQPVLRRAVPEHRARRDHRGPQAAVHAEHAAAAGRQDDVSRPPVRRRPSRRAVPDEAHAAALRRDRQSVRRRRYRGAAEAVLHRAGAAAGAALHRRRLSGPLSRPRHAAD